MAILLMLTKLGAIHTRGNNNFKLTRQVIRQGFIDHHSASRTVHNGPHSAQRLTQ